ncbi:hypothetical protein Pla22_19270 [Rubripirellula amarantea]|uniref:Uncharacterized protein n=1 Tax=Rubripirellula amarantea TaxID=2527999 RepID=A0A5C5WWH2_9BACT|nr:hypothetical protein Pla22_19270 [Rubripirellula amarantea]
MVIVKRGVLKFDKLKSIESIGPLSERTGCQVEKPYVVPTVFHGCIAELVSAELQFVFGLCGLFRQFRFLREPRF